MIVKGKNNIKAGKARYGEETNRKRSLWTSLT